MCLSVCTVSGLSYPHHTESHYRVVMGACPDMFYLRQSYEVTPVTCRFLCDTSPPRRLCHGYTYFPVSQDQARLGATVSTCQFISGKCPAGRRRRRAYTYFREKPTAATTTVTPRRRTRAQLRAAHLASQSWLSNNVTVTVRPTWNSSSTTFRAVTVEPQLKSLLSKAVPVEPRLKSWLTSPRAMLIQPKSNSLLTSRSPRAMPVPPQLESFLSSFKVMPVQPPSNSWSTTHRAVPVAPVARDSED